MGSLQELKKLLKFENWKFSVLLLWLLAGIGLMNFFPFLGIFILLPFLTFVIFLFLISLVSKKNIQDYSSWKIILLLIVSLPLMILISGILFALFSFSMFSYIFLTSWFALYGCYLTGKGISNKLESKKTESFLKGLVFSGGTIGAFLLLIGLFLVSIYLPLLLDNITPNNLSFLNLVYLTVGILLIILLITSLIYLSKKVFVSWSGVFFLLIVVYSFYLALKVFLSMSGTETTNTNVPTLSSLPSEIALVIGDLFILMYAIATIMGSYTELLTQKLKRFKEDTILMWLIFSKASYEFAVNFPYDIVPNFQLPFIESIVWIGQNLSFIKNIGSLIIFIFLILVLGIYEMRKHYLIKKKKRPEKLEEPLLFIRRFTDRFRNNEQNEDYNLAKILHEKADENHVEEIPHENKEKNKIDSSIKSNNLDN